MYFRDVAALPCTFERTTLDGRTRCSAMLHRILCKTKLHGVYFAGTNTVTALNPAETQVARGVHRGNERGDCVFVHVEDLTGGHIVVGETRKSRP